MAEITTTQAFSDGDTVTATKLNNITANAAIQTEAITNRSSETTVDQANDLLLMYDASATALKKISLSNVIRLVRPPIFQSQETPLSGERLE